MNHLNKDINYFRIGTFTVIGLAILVIAILIFGSGKLFQKTVYVETYFDESVQGLSEGSPVKYRGLQIGYIKKLSFVSAVYNHSHPVEFDHRYIYVETAITSVLFTRLSDEKLQEMLQRYIQAGLRFRTALQGLTGTAYLELNFFNPKENPILPITWQPNNFYIPSTQSTLMEFTDNVQYVFDELKKVKIHELVETFQNTGKEWQSVAKKIDSLLTQINPKTITISNNLEILTQNLRSISTDMKNFPPQLFFGDPPPYLDLDKL